VMGMATEKLGLGSTCSTTYFEPFHVARVFQTLDLMTNGRAAWNIVTSMNDGEALNMGHATHGDHDQRYDRADEFLEVVMGHWDSWEDDALVVDKKTGLFAHPDKIRRLDHQGAYFRSRGPFTVPRSPQGHPVLIQAGQSGRGRHFAARWAELVFVNYHSLEHAREDYAVFKQQVAEAGRDPDKVAVAAGVYTVVAPTRAEAEDKVAMIDKLPKEIDQLSLLCEVLNVDLAKKPVDEPWTEEEIQTWTGAQGLRDRVYRVLGKRNPTTRDFMEVSHRGTFRDHPRFVGSPKDVADGMEEWFATGACDGYVVAACLDRYFGEPGVAFARYEEIRRERTSMVVRKASENKASAFAPSLADKDRIAEEVAREWQQVRLRERMEWLYNYDATAIAI